MKLFEHEETETTLEQLPELPHDVEVPDDISSIRHPTTPRTTGVRWIRWLAAVVVVGVIGVLGAMFLFGGETEDALTMDPMERYGTDNPVIISEGAVPAEVAGFMDLYGTDNPVIISEDAVPVDTMDLYGTDNPSFVDRTSMERYGTDNPVVVGD